MSRYWKPLALWVTIGCVLYYTSKTDAYFDCRRDGMECPAGMCDYFDTGECIACDGLGGPDCGYNMSLVSEGCTGELSCENGGICIDDGKLPCYCEPDFFGAFCERKRAEVECDSENMTITITPYEGFRGVIYVSDENGGAPEECTFKQAGPSYVKNFLLDTGCSPKVINDTPSEGDITYTRDVVIRYDNSTLTFLDQVVEVKCVHKESNVTAVNGTMASVYVDQTTNLTRETIETSYEPVSIEVLDANKEKIRTNIFVGRKLILQIALKDTAKYKSIKVESCVAVDGKLNGQAQSQNLIDKSCPTRKSMSVLSGPIQRSADQSKVWIPFKAFKFFDTTDIVFECKIRHCMAGDDRCDPKTCDIMNMEGFGKRKKRETNEELDAEEESIITKRIRVLDPLQRNILTDNVMQPEDCLQRKEIISSIVILASAVSLLLIVCLVLAVSIIRSRSRSPKIINSDCDSAQSTVSSDSTAMRIPRVTAVF